MPVRQQHDEASHHDTAHTRAGVGGLRFRLKSGTVLSLASRGARGVDVEFSIGELSKRAQVKVPTIRYYEGIGLLAAPTRTEGRQRRYGEDDAKRLNFIRHARELGFEVDAIRELLDMTTQTDRSCDEARRMARHHLDEVDRRISRLTALRGELMRMIGDCSQGGVGECRVIQVLADHDLCAGEKH